MLPETKLQNWLKQQYYEGILLSKRNNFSWLTQGQTNHIVNTTEFGVADLLIFLDKKFCITTKMESRRIMEEELQDLGYELVEAEWYEGTEAKLSQLCQGKKMCADHTRAGMDDVSASLRELRSCLSEKEIARYGELCLQAALTLECLCQQIQPGMTEYEIAGNLAQKVITQGHNPQVILVATDERIFKYRHPIPTGKKLERYAMLVLCAEQGGLVANVTRFVHFGNLPPVIEENKRKLAVIDTIMNAATRPGTSVGEVFNLGIAAYAAAGHPEDWRYLHQGGPTGYASREYLATASSSAPILVNQAFAWNPAIYGFKSEDTLMVGEKSNRFLTHTGQWVYQTVEHQGEVYLRPDILIR